MSASVELTFEKGAVKSTVKLEVTNIKATITNNTAETIVVTKNDNSKQNVLAGTKKATVNSTSTTGPVNPGTSGGTSGGSSVVKPVTPYKINTGSGIVATVTGEAFGMESVSNSSIKVEVKNISVTPAAIGVIPPNIECTVIATADGWTRTLGTMEAVAHNTYNKEKDKYIYAYDDISERFSINGAPIGSEITITVSCRVKETATTAASTAHQLTTEKFVVAKSNEWTAISLVSADNTETPEA